jgi:putative polyhydroxyalkanoate system protein
MPVIHLEREHSLGLASARKLAWQWAEQVEADFDMSCTYEEGARGDAVLFNRPGVSGCLVVEGERFVLDATLGFLLGAFKDRIETEIVKNLDALLAGQKPAAKKPAAQKAAAKKKTT